MKQKSREEIARVAYDLWEKGGRQNGKETENWTAAEKMIMEQNKSECGGSKKHDEIRKIAYMTSGKRKESQSVRIWTTGSRPSRYSGVR